MKSSLSQSSDSQALSHALIDSLTFCVFDLETTGGNHTFDQIIEIGLVKVKERQIVDSKHYFINPGIPIPEFIQKLTSIKEKDVKDAPKIIEVLDDILEFMGDDILVAHNISFDIPFFNSVLVRHNREKLKNREMCTNIMTKHLIPEIMNSNLNYMSSLFNLNHGQAHRAIEDAKATAELLITYLNFFISKGIKKINNLYYPRNKFEIDRVHFEKGTDHAEILKTVERIKSPFLMILKGEEGVLTAVVPVQSAKEEKAFIEQELSMSPWTQITIKMMSPYLECLWGLNLHWDKLSTESKVRLKHHLIEIFPTDHKIELKELGFILGRHLIPEQFNIYSGLSFMHRTHLTFRYPAQAKKMGQYILSHQGRFEINKKQHKFVVHQELADVFLNFLAYARKNLTEHYLFLDLDLVKNSPKKFTKTLEEFTSKAGNPYNYPEEHL
ncbi:MAG: PolC-type DNA polymerase III [Bacteriovoracaceae bacterium]